MTDVHVPYTHVREATYLYLLQHYNTPEYPVVWQDVSGGDWAYNHYLSDSWYAGRTFINLEHDIVPWPGAVESIDQCEKPWCFYGYRADLRMVEIGAANFGLVKFSDVLIATTKNVWKDMRDDPDYSPINKPWRFNDLWFFQYATKLGFVPHQHWPSVLNAHPPDPKLVNMNAEGVLQCPTAKSLSTST